MGSPQLENLVRIRQLKEEAPARSKIDGLIRSGCDSAHSSRAIFDAIAMVPPAVFAKATTPQMMEAPTAAQLASAAPPPSLLGRSTCAFRTLVETGKLDGAGDAVRLRQRGRRDHGTGHGRATRDR
jgi:hypothetical protein